MKTASRVRLKRQKRVILAAGNTPATTQSIPAAAKPREIARKVRNILPIGVWHKRLLVKLTEARQHRAWERRVQLRRCRCDIE
jgi:hypothetical protein